MKQKTVLITGASSGIGKETARQLIREGYLVYAAARRLEQMADLQELGGIPLQMDITREEDVQAVVSRIEQDRGGVDILINNAGFGLYGAMEDIPLDEARYQFEVNLFGLARLTQLVLPYMRAQRAGTIVNISSVGGKIYMPLGSWYHATKHALEGWSDSLRLELKPFNIDVVIVEPGLIDTGFSDVLAGPMGQHSADGPYREMVLAVANAAGGGNGLRYSPPAVIAETISRALKARQPRTRYAAGSMAKPLILARRLLSDRLFDWAVSRMV